MRERSRCGSYGNEITLCIHNYDRYCRLFGLNRLDSLFGFIRLIIIVIIVVIIFRRCFRPEDLLRSRIRRSRCRVCRGLCISGSCRNGGISCRYPPGSAGGYRRG